jgi:hypothetical protein
MRVNNHRDQKPEDLLIAAGMDLNQSVESQNVSGHSVLNPKQSSYNVAGKGS